jgi:tRNA A64-2'-O-ribosylphosphate transferase
VYHANKASLLSADRDDLLALIDELVEDAGVAWGMAALGIGASEMLGSATPVGPGLFLDIGPTSQPAENTSKPGGSRLVVRVVELNKPIKDAPYIFPVNKDKSSPVIIFGMPSARSHAKEFLYALAALDVYLDGFPIGRGTDLVVSPGTRSELDKALEWHRSDKKEEAPETTLTPVSAMAPGDLQSARKAILPLAIALLCSIPALSTDASAEIDKSAVADHLHNLIALWPNGNPPRAALKRVNEFLMSDERE